MPNAAEAMLGKHKSVLLHEAIEGLGLAAGKIFLDATFGAGGHTKEALRRFPGLRAIGLDQDPAVAEAVTQKSESLEVYKENFRNLERVLEKLGIGKIDAVLFDLGFSSDQLESSGRGFSFQKDEPLDMRLSGAGSPPEHSFTAADILNSWDEQAIELILRGFGEEKYSRRIAKSIVKRRAERPFRTTFDLVETIESSIPRFARTTQGKHPATRTFQALRIAVNAELDALEEGLAKAWEALAENGRLAVISFHSLEDRIVKRFFLEKSRSGEGRLLTKKPITASEEELEKNPRSRSAKLRIIEKI